MDLARDEKNWNRVVVCDSQPGCSVSHAWPRRDAAHAQLSGRSCITIGHQSGRLLMTHEDVFDLWVAIKRIVNRHRMRAWYSKHDTDAVLSQTRDNEFA